LVLKQYAPPPPYYQQNSMLSFLYNIKIFERFFDWGIENRYLIWITI